jgi:hypothetical protein
LVAHHLPARPPSKTFQRNSWGIASKS